MRAPTSLTRRVATVVFSVLFVVLAIGVSVAFASLNFNGTSITGDTGSSLDATGTVTIGATQATGITIGRSGITATFPGTVTVAGTTTTLQNLVISGSCTGTGCLVPGGDLSGSGSSQTVVGLQGRTVSSTAPSANQVLTWNGTTWAPASTGSGITAINGLSNATTSIVGAGGITVSTSSPNTITITGSAGAITINSIATTTFQVQGTANQITVATSAPNIIALSLPQNIATGSSPTFNGITITSLGSAGSPCLTVSAGGAVATTTCGAGGTVPTINGITSSTFTFAAGSGLSVASSANPNVITYAFTNPGYVTAASSVTWTAAEIFNGATTFNGTSTHNSSTLLIGPTAIGTGTLNGALNILGAVNQQGGVVSLASTTITGNATTTALSITGLAGASGCLSVSASGAVTTSTCSGGGGGSPSINGITSSTFNFLATGGVLTIASSANPNNITYTWTNPGYVTAASSVTWTAAQTFNSPVIFNATATFLGPIVESSTGAGSIQLTEGTCPAGSSGDDILCANSSHALELSLNGGSFIAIPQIAGDIGGTSAAPAVVALQGRAVSSTAPSNNQVLAWNGTTWAPANASGTGGGSGSVTTSSPITANNFPFWANTTGGLSGTSTLSISGNTITNSGNANLGGNLNVTGTAAFSATTTFLGAIQGGSPSSTEGMQILEGLCPSAVAGSDILCANSSTHAFQISLNGGSYISIPQLAGDLGNAAASPKVTGLQGVAVSSTAPSSNQCLVYNGTTWAPGSCGGASLSGGQANYVPLWTGASSLGTSTLQATANALVTSGGFAVGTTTNQAAGNLFVTGNATTTNLSITGLAGASGCLSVSGTGAVTTSTCSGGSSITAVDGLSNSTTSIVAGSNITITTSSPNVITIAASGGGGSLSGGQANYIPLWTSTSTLATSTLSVSGNTVTNSGNQQVGGTLNVTGTTSLQATTTVLGNVSIGTTTFKSASTTFQVFSPSADLTASSAVTVFIGDASSSRPGCIAMSMYPTGTVWGYIWLNANTPGLIVATTTPCN